MEEITDCEKKLLAAFAGKDLALLDELIHDAALFVLPNGQTVTKPMVIENYRSGSMAMSTLNSSDRQISMIGDTAVVSLNLELKGSYLDQQVNATFRYIRVWKLFNNSWQVIATGGVATTAGR